MALYKILELVDESVNDNNEVKKYAEGINLFSIVNNLRKERMTMVNTYNIYKLIFVAMDQYLKNTSHFTKIRTENIIPTSQSAIDNDGLHTSAIHDDVSRSAHVDGPFYANICNDFGYLVSQGGAENNDIYFTETHEVMQQGEAENNGIYFTDTHENDSVEYVMP